MSARRELKFGLAWIQFRPTLGSLQTPNTEFISKELRTPDPEFFRYLPSQKEVFEPVFRIRRILGTRVADPNPDPPIHVFLCLLDPDPDPLVRGMDPDPDPSSLCKNSKKILDFYFFLLFK